MKQDPTRLWREAVGLYDQGHYEAAGRILTLLQPLRPDHPPLRHLLAMCRYNKGEITKAIDDILSLVEEHPDLTFARIDLATILGEQGRAAEALQVLEQAYRSAPQDISLGLNLCLFHGQAGDWESADRLSQELIARRPEPELIWMRALLALNFGHFEEGWRHYGIRWRLPPTAWNSPRRDLGLIPVAPGVAPSKPFWLWTEQGIGDELVFASVLADARAAGLRFIFGCNPRNIPLYQRQFPDLDVRDVARVQRADLNGVALQMPLADLVALMRPTRAAFPVPAAAGYLTADSSLRDQLRQRYLQGRPPGERLVGISWHSGKAQRTRQKSTALTDWLPILQLPGTTFVSLQYGQNQAILQEMQDRHGIRILQDPSINPLGPSDPVAAQTAAMDAVVTVSNTAAHVAGALGVPTIVMLPAAHGLQWYWQRDTERSLWYGNTTLLRQEKVSHWQPVIAEAAKRLQQILSDLR